MTAEGASSEIEQGTTWPGFVEVDSAPIVDQIPEDRQRLLRELAIAADPSGHNRRRIIGTITMRGIV